MSIQAITKQVAVGAQQNVRVLVEDLEVLKALQRDNESLAVTFHRVIEHLKSSPSGLKGEWDNDTL